jgi:hypothetical protein
MARPGPVSPFKIILVSLYCTFMHQKLCLPFYFGISLIKVSAVPPAFLSICISDFSFVLLSILHDLPPSIYENYLVDIDEIIIQEDLPHQRPSNTE